MFGQPTHNSIFPGAHSTLVNEEDVEKGGHQDDTSDSDDSFEIIL